MLLSFRQWIVRRLVSGQANSAEISPKPDCCPPPTNPFWMQGIVSPELCSKPAFQTLLVLNLTRFAYIYSDYLHTCVSACFSPSFKPPSSSKSELKENGPEKERDEDVHCPENVPPLVHIPLKASVCLPRCRRDCIVIVVSSATPLLHCVFSSGYTMR